MCLSFDIAIETRINSVAMEWKLLLRGLLFLCFTPASCKLYLICWLLNLVRTHACFALPIIWLETLGAFTSYILYFAPWYTLVFTAAIIYLTHRNKIWNTLEQYLKHRNKIWNTETISETQKTISETQKQYLKHRNNIWNTETISETQKQYLKHGNDTWNTETISETQKQHTETISETQRQYLKHRNNIRNTQTISETQKQTKFMG